MHAGADDQTVLNCLAGCGIPVVRKVYRQVLHGQLKRSEVEVGEFGQFLVEALR